MQRRYLKFVAAVILLIFIASHTASAQTSHRLRTADSLFTAKRYTQSFEHYDEILRQNQYTPAMLLKMAYIKEGLLQIGPALYYLNLYYIATADKSALEKMNELASKYNLQGYETSDADRALSFFHDYQPYITAALAALMIFLLSLSVYTKLKLRKKPIASFVVLAVLAIAMLVNINFTEKTMRKGIVASPTTYIMSGPSAAANVIEIIGDGHRVEILDEKDVWIKVSWGGNVGYVKQNALLPVRL